MVNINYFVIHCKFVAQVVDLKLNIREKNGHFLLTGIKVPHLISQLRNDFRHPRRIRPYCVDSALKLKEKRTNHMKLNCAKFDEVIFHGKQKY